MLGQGNMDDHRGTAERGPFELLAGPCFPFLLWGVSLAAVPAMLVATIVFNVSILLWVALVVCYVAYTSLTARMPTNIDKMKRSASADRWMQAQYAAAKIWFPKVVIRGTPLRGERNIRLISPHGVLPICGVGAPDSCVYHPEYVLMIAEALWWLPGFRELAASTKMMYPLSMVKPAMQRGQSFEMFLGGCYEAALSHPGVNEVYVTPRKGIFKYQKEFGYTVQPRFTFGETDLYHTPGTLPILGTARWRGWLAETYRIPLLLHWGWFFCIPRRRPMMMAFGEPIVPGPGDTVHSLQQRYIASLRKLVEDHREEYEAMVGGGYRMAPLSVI